MLPGCWHQPVGAEVHLHHRQQEDQHKILQVAESDVYIFVEYYRDTISRMNGKPSNPPSGTVVDSDVTLPERFALISRALFSHKFVLFVKVRLFPGVAICEPGHCQPHLLQRGEGYFWAAAQAHPSANLQAHPPLLQLAWHCQGPRSMPVCAQACLPCKYLF